MITNYNKNAITIIESELRKDDVQAGYPMDDEKGIAFELRREKNTTWCNRFLFRVMQRLSGSAVSLCEEKGINFTNANQMIANMENRLVELSESVVMDKILSGYFVVCGRKNESGHGHVALVIGKEGSKIMIAQAGKKTGVMSLEEGFGGDLSKVKFFCYSEV